MSDIIEMAGTLDLFNLSAHLDFRLYPDPCTRRRGEAVCYFNRGCAISLPYMHGKLKPDLVDIIVVGEIHDILYVCWTFVKKEPQDN